MSEFHWDLRDVKFALFDQFKLQELGNTPMYEGYDESFFQTILESAHKFASEQLAPINAEGDAKGVRLEGGRVYLPESFEPVYRAFCENGWLSISRNPEFGGMGMPYAMAVACIEMFCAANPSFMFTPGLTDAAAHLIETFGSDDHKNLFVERMYSGHWGGTMCLTEPQAGSSVGDLSTKAEPVEGEDYYSMTGNKIFISSGDQQLTENIVHLVLARVPGDPIGTRGISLFAVPRQRFEEDGTVKESNDVTVSGLEHKMGIHASATCALSFGDEGECRGWLIGERCRGLQYMFQMMNEARVITGLQGSAIGNAAYQLALAYAQERRQGPKLTDRSDEPQSVAIIEHPDVRRNLMLMKSQSEALRALCLRVSSLSDWAKAAEDEEDRTKYQDLADLLTPVVKAFCSDVGFEITEHAIQVHGGYGYIKEYGVEQAMRDAKIASIYEGTNGIQALDLMGRKMRMKNGGLFLTWLQDINTQLAGWSKDEAFGPMAKQLEGAKNALCEAGMGFGQQGRKDPEYPMLHATPFLRMFGLVESARLLMEQADIAREKLRAIWSETDTSEGDDQARRDLATARDDVRYYEGKIKGAQFFVFQCLPEVRALLTSVQSGDRSALEIVF